MTELCNDMCEDVVGWKAKCCCAGHTYVQVKSWVIGGGWWG